MTESLLTISAFARAVELSAGTLRYYDEAGLLRPAEVDARTGYRYYTADLERRAHMIRRMRDVGVPIETMRRILDGPTDDAIGLLREFAHDASASAARTQDAIGDIVTSLRQEPTGPGPVDATVDGPELAAALRRVLTAATDEPGSPLAVVAFELDADVLTLAATDRYWMATWRLRPRIAEPSAHDRRFIVGRDDIPGLVDWLARADSVQVTGTESSLVFADSERDDLTIALTEDRFPAFRMLLTAAPATAGRATIDRRSMLDAITGWDDAAVLRVGINRVTVQPRGDVEGVRLAATTTGEPIQIGFSPTLLSTALTATVGTEATLAFDAADRAVRITSPDQRNFTALVMPVRLDAPQ